MIDVPAKRRVLFLQGAGYRAGAERALLARLRHLPERGIEPVVAFFAEGPFRAELERAGVPTRLLGEAPHVRNLPGLAGATRALAALAREERADLMEGCGEKMSLLAGWSSRLARCGCVYNLQDAPLRGPRTAAVQLVAACGRHDAVVVPSRWMARAFRRAFALQPVVIPNAVILDDLPDRPADVRSLADWPEGVVVVGLFGRLVAWKGAEVFLRAARRVLERRPETRFLVAGGTLYGWEPEHQDRLVGLARMLGVADRVHFAGHREDALELMAGCDVVCHCSTEREPFGMVVVEAMALGRPTIATRTGGPEELIDDGRSGVLVDPGNDAQLAAEIVALVASPAERASLGRAARDVARERFGSRAVADVLSALYLEVAARRSR